MNRRRSVAAADFAWTDLAHCRNPGKPFLDVKHGRIDVDKVIVSGQPSSLRKTR